MVAESRVSQEFADALRVVRPGRIQRVGWTHEDRDEFVIMHREDWQKLIDLGVVQEEGAAELRTGGYLVEPLRGQEKSPAPDEEAGGEGD